MKLQTYGVIFVLIFIPLVLVLSYYISLQIDTLTLQNKYDKKLLDATYDALSAFEINTANEDLSSVSDALRTIIEASTNVFFNTLATNMGMSNASKSLVEPNIPALLYTLYDGYYIYTPTKVPTHAINFDGVAVAVGDVGVVPQGTTEPPTYYYDNEIGYDEYDMDNYAGIEDMGTDPVGYGSLIYETDTSKVYTTDPNEANLKTKSVLKTYIPYSARYVIPGAGPDVEPIADITVVYSLDNYISISGMVKGIRYTKCGYLIPNGSVELSVGSNTHFFDRYNETSAQYYIEEQGTEVTVNVLGDTSFTTTGSRKSELTYSYNTLANYYIKIQEINNRLGHAPAASGEDFTNYLAALDFSNFMTNCALSLQEKSSSYGFLTPGFDPTSISINPEDYTLASAYALLDVLKTEVNYHMNRTQYELDLISAAAYYAKAKIFSDWVQEFLNNPTGHTVTGPFADACVQIKESDLIEISNTIDYRSINGTETIIHDFASSDAPVFNVVNTESNTTTSIIPGASTEIAKDSTFYTHKMYVIRNSIQYNLNLAMSTYNNNENYTFDYAMPVISDDEWNTILTHISLTAFMQGADCGLKKYNNYMIVSSSNNELVTDTKDIYYVPVNSFNDEDTEFHKVDCFEMKSFTPDTNFIAFPSKEVKYDKLYVKSSQYVPYRYDHKNLACYRCINDSNYSEVNIFAKDASDHYNAGYDFLRRAFYIGVGKIRNNVYKMTSFTSSDGYEVIYDRRDDHKNNLAAATSKLNYSYIKAVEIVFDALPSTDRTEQSVTFQIGDSGMGSTQFFNDFTYSIPTFRTSPHTESVQLDPNKLTGTKVTQRCTAGNLFFDNKNASSQLLHDPDNPLEPVPNIQELIRQRMLYVRVIYR